MSDRKVKIDIETTADTSGAKQSTKSLAELEDKGKDVGKAIDDAGKVPGFKKLPAEAKAAEGSLDALEEEVKRLNLELNKLPVGSKQFVDLAGKAKEAKASLALAEAEAQKLGATVGKNGNAGGAVLEFSRAFEDAQYGIRGVLNNIPGLIAMLGGGAGLAGIISIAAVAGTQLWERLSDEKKADDSVNAIAKPLGILKEMRDALQAIGKAERERKTQDFSEVYDKQKKAIEGESLAIKGSNDVLQLNLDYRQKLAALETKEALAEITKSERSGKITPTEANSKRVQITAANAANERRFQKESRDLEVKPFADEKQKEEKINKAAKEAAQAADLELESRKKQISTTSQQIKLRENLDRQKDNLLAQEGDNEKLSLRERVKKTGKRLGLDSSDPLDYEKILKAIRDEGEALAKSIKDINDRIAKEAPQPVKPIQNKKADGSEGEIKNRRFVRSSDELLKGSKDGKTESLETLEQRKKDLNQAVVDSEDRLKKANDDLAQKQSAVGTKGQFEDVFTQRQNPAKEQGGKFTATQIDQGLSGVEGQLGEVANLPAVRKIIDRVKELAADGIQGGEQNEVATLAGQLVSKIKKPNEDTAKLFQKLLEAINASVDLQTRFAGQIDEVKRRVATIEQGAQGAQRGF